MELERLVKHLVDNKRMLRSEILGLRYMYSITKRLSLLHSVIEELASEIEVDYEELEDIKDQEFYEIAEHNINLLGKIDAVEKSLSMDTFYLTKYGKVWFDLLTELNLPINQIEPLKVVYGDIPGKFYLLLKDRITVVKRLVIVSPWISERSLVRRITRIIKQTSAATLVFTRTPRGVNKERHEECLDLIKEVGGIIYLNDNLHSKLYVCETKIEKIHNSFAIVGSANLSRTARFDNVEVGVLIFGYTYKYLNLIENLIRSCNDLKGRRW